MATIEEAVRDQLKSLVADVLTKDARVLTGAGISKQRRNYLKRRDQGKDSKKLPPADAVLAALILLRREIIVQGVFGSADGKPRQYLIAAFEQREGAPISTSAQPVQMSLLAALDFSPESVATIERAERKGPHRVELQLNVKLHA